MKGKYSIVVENRNVSFRFSIQRKFTIIKGDSAKGKSYFCNMLLDKNSVKIDCKANLIVVTDIEVFKSLIKESGNILILDEGIDIFKNILMYSKQLKCSDNYFIFITRHYLRGVPYSVREMYSFVSKKEDSVSLNKESRTITTLKPLYNDNCTVDKIEGVIITEDTKAGNDFYRRYLPKCIVYPEKGSNKGGKGNVKLHFLELLKDGKLFNKRVFIIVDSAAFGDEIEELMSVININMKDTDVCPNEVIVLLPESFEYLICGAKVGIDDNRLSKTYDYCDAKSYSTWEKYYTDLVSDVLDTYKNSKSKYSKKVLCKEVMSLSSKMLLVLYKKC